MSFLSPAVALRVSLRALVTLYALACANHAGAGGLGDLLRAVESLDQSIQEKVQGVLGSTESDHQEASEAPDSESTATSVDSERVRIKAEPRVASESAEDEEEDQEESNVVSSEIIKLKPDRTLPKHSEAVQNTLEPGAVPPVDGVDPEDISDSKKELAPETSKVADNATNRGSNEQADILWLGNATDLVVRFGANGGETMKEVVWQVRLREGYRLNIVDKDDRLLGQFVRLDDDGSKWSASQFGQIGCPDGAEVEYGGGGSGALVSGSPAGWVYYSLVDVNPLKDVLPDGAYFVDALDKSDGRTFWKHSGVTVYHHNELAGLRWSVENSNPVPDQAHNGMRVSADLFRSGFRYFTGDYSTWDPEIRVLVNSQMSGSYLRPILPGTSKCVSKTERRAFWHVDRVQEIKPLLEKAQKNWRPEYDNTANMLSVTANIEQPAVPGKFRFTLFDVTRERGWAMNAGDREDDSLDLEFVDGLDGFSAPEETLDGWTIETNRTMTAATVVVKANDYGAWGRLKCEVNPGGHWFPCNSEDGKRYVTIPYDEDENKIADFWEEQKGISGDAAADGDETPEGREPGDGFSNYEEYRGFKIKGEWTDTDPKQKDLFVHNDADVKKFLVDAGIDLFTTASELTVHRIEADEYDQERIVNFNRGEHQAITRNLKGQKGLHITVTDEDRGEGVCGKVDRIGTPNMTEEVWIKGDCLYPERYERDKFSYWKDGPGPSDQDSILVFYSSIDVTLSEYGMYMLLGLPVKMYPMRVSTVAHELGHAVNLHHPGYSDWCGEGTADPNRGSAHSGPEDNLMRYTKPFHQYVGGECYEFPGELDKAPLTTFVRQLEGSGINAGELRKIQDEDGQEYWLPMAGDATCTGTLITNMSLNQDKTTDPPGCGL